MCIRDRWRAAVRDCCDGFLVSEVEGRMNASMTSPVESAECRAARRRALGWFFAPRTIAVIGASAEKGSVGRSLLENLREFNGQVFPVNPNHSSILQVRAFPCVGDVPLEVDLAVIAT